MNNTYTLHVEGLTRELPIIRLTDDLSIASFVILGDTEIVSEAAKELVKKLPEVDIHITAEAKGIPLIYEMSKLLGMKNYVVARKSIKAYMDSPIVDDVFSITTQKMQILVLEEKYAKLIKSG